MQILRWPVESDSQPKHNNLHVPARPDKDVDMSTSNAERAKLKKKKKKGRVYVFPVLSGF